VSGCAFGRQFDEPAKHRDRRVGLAAVVLHGPEVGERPRAPPESSSWAASGGASTRRSVLAATSNVEIPIGALGPRTHVASRFRSARRSGVATSSASTTNRSLYRVILLSVMSVSRTVPPAGTVTPGAVRLEPLACQH